MVALYVNKCPAHALLKNLISAGDAHTRCHHGQSRVEGYVPVSGVCHGGALPSRSIYGPAQDQAYLGQMDNGRGLLVPGCCLTAQLESR